jgi:hypothetical protein
MTVMVSLPMLSRRTEFSRRAVRWLWLTALLMFTPKCLLCVLTYVGLGAALGRGGSELCGITAGSPASWASLLAGLGVAAGVSAAGAHVFSGIGKSKPRQAIASKSVSWTRQRPLVQRIRAIGRNHEVHETRELEIEKD